MDLRIHASDQCDYVFKAVIDMYKFLYANASVCYHDVSKTFDHVNNNKLY